VNGLRSVKSVAVVELLFIGLAGLACALAAGRVISADTGGQVVLAAAAIVLALGLCMLAFRHLLYVLVVWLVALGFVRRIAAEIWNPGAADPLLVVGPVALLLLALIAFERGALRDLTLLSKAVLVVTGLALIGAVNPLQGSLAAGITSLLFIVVPTLAFWVGRGLCDDRTLTTVFTVVMGFGVLAAVYGIVQTFWTFPSWDEAWIEASQVGSLTVGGTTRAFASFLSSADYALFLAIALAAWLTLGMRRSRLLLTVPAAAAIGVALVYSSGRGAVFTLLVAIALVVAARLRLPFIACIASVACIIVAVTLVAAATPSSLRDVEAADSGPEQLLAHQLDGLANPLDEESSTLGLHVALVEQGLRSSLAEPFGVGIGAISIAGQKFGAERRGSEADPSNLGIALGLPGILAYAVLLVFGITRAYAVAARRRDALALLALAIPVIMLFQWFNGGLYAAAPLMWLALGWVDRSWQRSPSEAS
jgi:hypothetical protein